MIIDTSALLAILFQEPEGPAFPLKIAQAPTPLMSAGNFLEAAIVADRSQDTRRAKALDALLGALGIEGVPVTMEQVRVAREAYSKFGKGVHPAGLNFGDCFAYALAKTTASRLLFKGDLVSQTDIQPAI